MLLLLPALVLLGEPPMAPSPAKELPVAEAFAKARVNGKHRLLLRRWPDPAALAAESAFKEWFSRRRRLGGQKNLPAGHWAYVYPLVFVCEKW